MSNFVFLPKIRKFKMAAIFESQKSFEIWAEYLANAPWGSKISTKSLYLAPLRRYEQFCVFAENSKIQNGRHFSKVGVVYSLDTLGVENFNEIALSPTVKEIEAILCFYTFSTKIQNGRHFFKKFFKSGFSVFLRYPGGRKFRRNRSISNG